MFCSNMNTQRNPEECVCVCVCVWGGGGGGGEKGREGRGCHASMTSMTVAIYSITHYYG